MSPTDGVNIPIPLPSPGFFAPSFASESFPRLELARHLNHGAAEAHPCEERLRRLVSFGSRQDDARRATRPQVRLGRL
jgi:hypothetical protein